MPWWSRVRDPRGWAARWRRGRRRRDGRRHGLAADAPRLALARELGATHTLIADQEDAAARVRELTDGEGPQVVVDVTGGPARYRCRSRWSAAREPWCSAG